MSQTSSPTAPRHVAGQPSSFPFPTDSQAWWNVGVNLGVGWLLILGARPNLQGLALTLAALGLFFSSEWLSQLSGRSREGVVSPGRWDEPMGLGLLAVTAASLFWFVVMSERLDREAWATVITGVACPVALMFVLRMEWRPLDGRLLYLTHLILTLPSLVFGFVMWGVAAPQAFGAWILPAVYFPAQALFTQYWMEGPDAPASALSVLATPLLVGILLQATRNAWAGVVFLALFLLRAIWLMQSRRMSGGLPGFARVKQLSWEIQAWNLGAVIAWALAVR